MTRRADPQGKIPALTGKIPKTGGRGKPLPYGMVGNVPQQGTGESGTRPYGKPQGTGESGTRPYGEPRIFPGHGGSPPPLRDGGETSRNGGRAATEGRPYDVFSVPFGFGVTQARFRGCGGHRIAQGRNCPVGAGLLTRPPFVDHDARRARRLKGRSPQR